MLACGKLQSGIEAGGVPQPLSRYREEVYESKAYKAKIKKERLQALPAAIAIPKERDRLRAEYFRKSRKGHSAVPAWKRLDAF